MARARLGLGEAGDINTKRIDGTNRWRARVRYRDALGAYHWASAVGPTKTKATSDLRDKLDTLTGTAQIASVTTVGELCERWLDRALAESSAYWTRSDAAERRGSKPPRPQSMVHSVRAVRNIRARPGGIGDLRLNEATTLALETWLFEQAEESRGRAAEIRIVLRKAFHGAVRLGLLVTDPMAGVDSINRTDPRPIALKPEELRAIRSILTTSPNMQAAHTTVRNLDALIVILLGTGMRVGEAGALRWSDLDLDGHDPTVTISGTQVELKGKGVLRQDVPKTESSNRTLLLPPSVVDAIEGIRPAWWKPTDWVFPTRNGTPWNTGNAAKVLDRVVELSGGALQKHRVSFHKLRSTAATAIDEEHGQEIAGLVLGHKLTGITRTHYIARAPMAPDVRHTLERLVRSSLGTARVGEQETRKPAKGQHLRAV
ncbi:site-specific integrase [Isoptericola hypogeus]|uniref:Site-specific integrase n=1 Tax=Isoptericola hypogeus TaxID=300179 RepID=A0ABP4VYW5_9MICO